MDLHRGGTLVRYAADGHSFVCCHVANGDKGHLLISPEELKAIRTREAQEGGKVLTAAFRGFSFCYGQKILTLSPNRLIAI